MIIYNEGDDADHHGDGMRMIIPGQDPSQHSQLVNPVIWDVRLVPEISFCVIICEL